MIQVTPQMRIMVAVEPVDFRRGIDGMAQCCREVLTQDPFCGAVFVFRNQRRTAIKVLVYDGRGFWLCHKRFSSGRFIWWPAGPQAGSRLEAHELMVLLNGGDPARTRASPPWRSVQPAG